MELSSVLPRPAQAPAPATLPTLRVEYAPLGAQAILTQTDVLAVIGFGAAAPALIDPRYLRVALETATGAGMVEVWRGRGPLRHGAEGAIRWSCDGCGCPRKSQVV